MAHSCKNYGIPDGDPRYSHPLPWIGLYVAVASMGCAACMVFDLYRSLCRRRFWIASNLFSINAATLTILGVAAKFPSDMTTAMPGMFDQLAKLSGTVLVCIAMNHMMPSLGLMSGVAIFSNVAGLGILVATVSVNIWIQVGTGVSSNLIFYNLFFSISMMLMFAVLVSYSLGVIPTKNLLEQRYNSKHEELKTEVSTIMNLRRNRIPVEALKEYIKKYWLLALTSSPDYILRYSGMSTVNAVLCHGNVGGTFISVMITFLSFRRLPQEDRPCLANSAYRWSTPVVLFFQTVTIVLGSIESFLRTLGLTPTKGVISWGARFKIDRLWLQLLLEWKEAPLPLLECRGRKVRKLVLFIKRLVLDLFLKLQIGIMFCGKLFLLICGASWHLTVGQIRRLLYRLIASKPCISVAHDEGSTNSNMTTYVLHLEEDEEDNSFATIVVRDWGDYPRRLIESGRSHQPEHLLRFLKTQPVTFMREIIEPDCLHMDLNQEDQPTKWWALSLATIVAIARASARGNSALTLMTAVREGFKYVRFVEKNLDCTPPKKVQEAADMVWEHVDLYSRWFDVDVDKSATLGWAKSLGSLKDAAARQVPDELKHKDPAELPPRALAAKWMTKIVGSVLSRLDRSNGDWSWGASESKLMERLENYAAWVLVDCLGNLPLALFKRCSNGQFGERDEGVQESALVFGEVEEILIFLEQLNS